MLELALELPLLLLCKSMKMLEMGNLKIAYDFRSYSWRCIGSEQKEKLKVNAEGKSSKISSSDIKLYFCCDDIGKSKAVKSVFMNIFSVIFVAFWRESKQNTLGKAAPQNPPD